MTGATNQEPICVDDFKMHVLLIKEGPHWIAQGLEHDIAAQGVTFKEAIHLFGVLLLAEVRYDRKNGLKPLDRIGKAPQRYWDQLRRGEPIRLQRQDRHYSDGDTGSLIDSALQKSEFVLV
jgi:hypothetical protein